MDILIPNEISNENNWTPANAGATFESANGVLLPHDDKYFLPIFDRFQGANLARYSEDFSNIVYWPQTGAGSVTGGVPDPVGGTDGWDLTDSDAAAGIMNLTQSIVLNEKTVSGSHTFSLYIKIGSAAAFSMSIAYKFGAVPLTYTVTVDTSGMSITSTTAGATSAIEQAAAGWYRLSITAPQGSVSNIVAECIIHPAGIAGGATGVTSVWGAQFTGGAISQYFKTTSSEVAARPFGVLVNTKTESAGTNLALWSENLGAASWNQSGAATHSISGIAPDGTSTLNRLVCTDILINSPQFYQDIAIPDDNEEYCLSIFVTGGTDGVLELVIGIIGGTSVINNIRFNPVTGQLISSTSDGATIERWGDNLWRISQSGTNNSSGNNLLRINLRPFDEVGVTGTLYCWGVQAEAGTLVPTSYMKSVGTSGTRAAFAAVGTDIMPAQYKYNNVERQEHVEWSAGTFNLGDYVQQNDLIYRCTKDPTTTDDPTGVGEGINRVPPTWALYGASNYFKLTDYNLGVDSFTEISGSADNGNGLMHIAIAGSYPYGFGWDSLAFFGLFGDRLFITDQSGTTEIDISSATGKSKYVDPNWTIFDDINITVSGVQTLVTGAITDEGIKARIGKLVLSGKHHVGILEALPQVRLIDLSTVTRDAGGNASKVQGRQFLIADYKIQIDTPDNQAQLDFFTGLRSTEFIGKAFVGDINRQETIMWGFNSDFKLNSSVAIYSPSSAQVTGL